MRRVPLPWAIYQKRSSSLSMCRGSFYAGMKQAVKGNRISDIGHAVEEYVKPYGYGIVRDFTGHGVGIELHESPSIPNYGKPGHGLRICDGMTLAIEPMINLGRDEVRILSDDWTTVTVDGKASAHYENTIAIVDGGPVIYGSGCFRLKEAGLNRPDYSLGTIVLSLMGRDRDRYYIIVGVCQGISFLLRTGISGACPTQRKSGLSI